MNNETKRDLTSFECILINPSDCDPRLHYASLAGFGEAIESLLENEPEMRSLLNHQISPIGATPLRLAATGLIQLY